MARGWESKSVELQQSAAAEPAQPLRKQATAEEIQQLNRKRTLELSRAKVAHELETAQNPRYQELLKTELAALDKRLVAFK